MTYFQSIVLGLVQGLSEFLPISSSAHLILFPWFLGWPEHGLAFDAFLHLGTLVAVGLYFFQDWMRLLRAGWMSIWERKIGYDADRLLFWLIVVGTIPAGAVGYLAHSHVEAFFRDPILTVIPLVLVGFLLFWVDGRSPTLRHVEDLRMGDSIWIGVAQAFAVIPGVSRSGATMLMGRFLGMHRSDAARYSFLLSVPIILAAGSFKGRELFMGGGEEIRVGVLVAGFLAAVFSGLAAIHVLLQMLRTADFAFFAWYRIGLGAVILLWSFLR